jgi:beta-lactamase regulating signal transducer with metallopeptidase domain
MLWWLAQNTLIAAVLAGIVALLCRYGRFNPAVKHALWLVVLVKLVMPPVVEWPWALPDLGQSFPSEVPALVETLEVSESPPEMEEPLAAILSGEDQPLFTALAFSEVMSEEPSSPPNQVAILPGWQPAWLVSLTLYLWLGGMVGMGLLQLIRITRFRRLVARPQPAPRWLAKQVAKLAAKLQVKRLQTLVVPGILSPCVWSLGRPKLLWPTFLLDRLSPDCRRSVIVHELAHLRRRDHWVGWLQMLAECVWWWNPLFWYVRRQLRRHAELACDAWVVATLPDDRRAYAEALIEVTQLVSETAAPTPALGMSSGARQDFERRLTMIMRDCVPCKVPLLGMVAIGLLALVALPGWSQVQVQIKKADEGKKEAAPEKPKIIELKNLINEGKAIEGDVIYTLKLDDGKLVKVEKDKPTTDGDRDRRLQALEQQLQALLKEVQALRAGSGATKSTPGQPVTIHRVPLNVRVVDKKDVKPPAEKKDTKDPKAGGDAWITKQVPGAQLHRWTTPKLETVVGTLTSTRDGQQTIHTITLSRATYKLPKAKAEALAKFLEQNAKVQVLEIKVEGDSLIITTTPEAQKAIHQFVSLLQGLSVSTSGGKTEWKEGTIERKDGVFKIEVDGKPAEFKDSVLKVDPNVKYFEYKIVPEVKYAPVKEVPLEWKFEKIEKEDPKKKPSRP